MPIYEYQCASCGHEFEELQKMSDKPIRKCPECAMRKVERLVSKSSFHLKGGGWYADGYGSSKSSKSNGNASKSPAKSDSASSTKSDSASSTTKKPAKAAASAVA